jgi:hypothetical protein
MEAALSSEMSLSNYDPTRCKTRQDYHLNLNKFYVLIKLIIYLSDCSYIN